MALCYRFYFSFFFTFSFRGDERGLSRKHIIESVKSSLERLQLDYIDVIIIHRADDMCPMEGKASQNRLSHWHLSHCHVINAQDAVTTSFAIFSAKAVA